MSHLHLPDGILPIWLWLLSYLILGGIFFCFRSKFKKDNFDKKIPLIGMMSALMMLSMSIELPIGYHINLAALTGILLAPELCLISVLIVNVFLVLLGHGGITTIALNTLILFTEASICRIIFKSLTTTKIKQGVKTFVAVALALIISTIISVSIFYAGTKEFSLLHTHSEEHVEEAHEEEHDENDIDFAKFITLIALAGIIGWSLEALISAFVVNYILRVKPEILSNLEQKASDETA